MEKTQDIQMEEIIALAKEAGIRTLDFFRKNVDVKNKEDNSPVTEADLAANDILVKGLSKYNIPILSEEMTPPGFDIHDYLWIIDPLDGTKSFIKGNDDFAVMVGLVYKNKPILGVVYQPSGDILYYAKKGEGAFVERNGVKHRLSPSDVSEIKNATLAVSNRAENDEPFKTMVGNVHSKKIVYVSSNGVKLCRISEGVYDMFFNPSGKLGQWDYCAPHAILEEAGGQICHIDGSNILYGTGWNMDPNAGTAASNGALQGVLLLALK